MRKIFNSAQPKYFFYPANISRTIPYVYALSSGKNMYTLCAAAVDI